MVPFGVLVEERSSANLESMYADLLCQSCPSPLESCLLHRLGWNVHVLVVCNDGSPTRSHEAVGLWHRSMNRHHSYQSAALPFAVGLHGSAILRARKCDPVLLGLAEDSRPKSGIRMCVVIRSDLISIVGKVGLIAGFLQRFRLRASDSSVIAWGPVANNFPAFDCPEDRLYCPRIFTVIHRCRSMIDDV